MGVTRESKGFRGRGVKSGVSVAAGGGCASPGSGLNETCDDSSVSSELTVYGI